MPGIHVYHLLARDMLRLDIPAVRGIPKKLVRFALCTAATGTLAAHSSRLFERTMNRLKERCAFSRSRVASASLVAAKRISNA